MSTEEELGKVAAAALGVATPFLFDWLKARAAGGSVDPAAELRAMLDSADLVAEAAERAAFGGDHG